MARNTSRSLTEKHFVTVISLLGLDEMGYPRTQSQVVKLTGYSRNAVFTYVKFLTDEKYLVEAKNSGRDKFYARGSKFSLIESQLTEELIHKVVKARHCRLNQEAYDNNEVIETVEPTQRDIYNEDGTLVGENCPIAFDIHQSGSWIQFRVERAGELYFADMKKVDQTTGKVEVYQQQIFSKNSEWEFDGGINWATAFVLPGKDLNRFQIRYQQSPKKEYFYVLPEFDVLATPDQVLNEEIVRTKFIVACTPLLRWFEKNAGWVFMKDEFGRYEITSSIKVDEVHKALRGPVNDALVDVTGGVFGRSEEGVWVDCSPGTPEFETNQAAYVEAVVKLPETQKKAELAFESVRKLADSNSRFNVRLVELEIHADSTNALLTKLMETNDKLTQIISMHTQNQANLLSEQLQGNDNNVPESQTKLADYYQPKEQAKEDDRHTEPPEGYR